MIEVLRDRSHLAICLGLIALTFAIYWSSLGNSLVDLYDDKIYVTQNPVVQRVRNYDAVANMAAAFGIQGKTGDAIRYFKRALALRPQDAQTHASLALAYFYKGQYTEAWKEIHLCQGHGGSPGPAFVQDLSAKMPDPGDD